MLPLHYGAEAPLGFEPSLIVPRRSISTITTHQIDSPRKTHSDGFVARSSRNITAGIFQKTFSTMCHMCHASTKKFFGIFDFYFRSLFCVVSNAFLLSLVSDAPWLVARYKPSVAQAVEQVFATSGEVVRIKGLHAVACKADNNALYAFRCSLCCTAQCWRFVMLRLGVR